MTPEELLASLLSENPPEDLQLLADFAKGGKDRRCQEEGGLAHGEWQDGLYYEEEEARNRSREEYTELNILAASPETRAVALRFMGGGWEIRAQQQDDGRWRVSLLGPDPATLEVLGETILLSPRVWTTLQTPVLPKELMLRLSNQTILRLRRS